MTDLQTQLNNYLEDAHAFEQQLARQLETWIESTDDPELVEGLRKRREATTRHEQQVHARLQARGVEPDKAKEGFGLLATLGTKVVDKVRSDNAGKTNRDGYAASAAKIASYELLTRTASRAEDQETAQLARQIADEERETFAAIDSSWDHAVEVSLAQEGVVASA